MGAGFSSANAVWLQTDKPLYYDGEFVQGVVCLNITKPVTITSIDCQLVGNETTYWTETHDHGTGSHHYTTTETYGSSVQLLNVTQQLGGAGREYQAGQYQWPIAFALPPGLPSSFRIGAGSEGAEVAYLVNLTFHTPGFLTKAIRSSQALTVRQRLAVPAEIVDQSAELALVSCCCISRGSVSAHVRLDKDRCQPGEVVSVILELDNSRSKLAVDAIELSLKREAAGYDRPGLLGSRRTFNKEYAKEKHPGAPPFSCLQGNTARRMALRLPPDLVPSMRGQLITCDYYVKAKLNIGSFVKDVRLKVPVLVLAPQPEPTPEAPFFEEPPPFWHPSVVAPPQAIDVPSAPPLPAELLQPDAPFWARSLSNKGGGAAAAAAAANGAAAAVPAAQPVAPVAVDAAHAKYPVV